jgi:hypothetical protein
VLAYTAGAQLLRGKSFAMQAPTARRFSLDEDDEASDGALRVHSPRGSSSSPRGSSSSPSGSSSADAGGMISVPPASVGDMQIDHAGGHGKARSFPPLPKADGGAQQARSFPPIPKMVSPAIKLPPH